MSLILGDIIIIPVILKWTVGNNMSLLSAEPAFSFWANQLVMARGRPVAVRAVVVRTIFSDIIPRLALKAEEVGTMDGSWGWRMGCGIVMCRAIYIDGVFPGSCCIGCSSHCLCVYNDCSNYPGSLHIESSGVLGNESSLEDCLPRSTKATWIGGDSNLWQGKSGKDRLVR